jgi:hypothetical protein
MKQASFSRLWILSLLAVLGLLEARQAGAAGEGNPTGTARAMHVDEEIHSGGIYSAATGSMARTVVDLVVPGGVGSYPLVFSRTSTSRYVPGDDGDGGAFGPGGSWRHTYRWGLFLDSSNPNVYGLHYPDGKVVTFCAATEAVAAPPTAHRCRRPIPTCVAPAQGFRTGWIRPASIQT